MKNANRSYLHLLSGYLIAVQLLLAACLGSHTGQASDAAEATEEEKTEQISETPVQPRPSAVTTRATTNQVRLSQEELKLYRLLMAHRKAQGLPEIPLSKSLTIVAQTHCKDLEANPSTVSARCNMHSWSNKGKWSACCYTSDHKAASCMWDKPRELTKYPGSGYEISHGTYGASVTAEGAFNGWKSSKGHNDVIVNRGIWKDKWNAIGIGMSKGFAMVWFGKEPDKEGSPAMP